jgi:hypothetical protein
LPAVKWLKSTDNADQAGNPENVLEKFIFNASSRACGHTLGEKTDDSRECGQTLAVL